MRRLSCIAALLLFGLLTGCSVPEATAGASADEAPAPGSGTATIDLGGAAGT